MELTEHIVRFDEWCNRCKHKKTDEIDSPCNECLDEPVNTNTRQPVLFEDKNK